MKIFFCVLDLSDPSFDGNPGEDYQLQFLRHYLRHRKWLEQEPEMVEADVIKLYNQVQKAKLVRFIIKHEISRNCLIIIFSIVSLTQKIARRANFSCETPL